MENILALKGKGWKYDSNASVGPDGNYSYTDSNNTVAWIALDKNNSKVSYSIDCTKFHDTQTQDKCNKDLGGEDNVSQSIDY